MKNPDRLLKKLRTGVNKNLRGIIKDHPEVIILPIPKKYLPGKCLLRLLYNQAYYNHYAGLDYSALSTCSILVERITRDFYEHFKPDPFKPRGEDTLWATMIDQLRRYFKNSGLEEKESLVSLMDHLETIKDRIRNLLLHGKVDEYIRGAEIEVKMLNVKTLKYEFVRTGYVDEIYKEHRFDILSQRIQLNTQSILSLISLIIEKHNSYLDLRPL